MNAANDIGSSNGIIYCLLTFPIGCGCCALVALGREVEEKRGIEGSIPKGALLSCLDCCCCYSCSVTHEAKLIKEEAAKGTAAAPAAEEIKER
jgi:hypothetical protein